MAFLFAFLFLVLLCCLRRRCSGCSGQADSSGGQGLKPILDYISSAWDTLTRSMTDCKSVVDPKIKVAPVLYLPRGLPNLQPYKSWRRTAMCASSICRMEIHRLGEIDTAKIQPHGLLYLPNKYVVPGGRFNEMYGWDSYFIIRGLLHAGRWNWRAEWSIISSSRSSTTVRCSTPTALIT